MFLLPTSKKSTDPVTGSEVSDASGPGLPAGAHPCLQCKHSKIISQRDWQWDLLAVPRIGRREEVNEAEGVMVVCRRNDERPLPLLCQDQRGVFGGCGPEGLAFVAKANA